MSVSKSDWPLRMADWSPEQKAQSNAERLRNHISDEPITDENYDTPQNAIYPMRYQGEVWGVEYVGDYDTYPFQISVEGFSYWWDAAVERVMRMPAAHAQILLDTGFVVNDRDVTADKDAPPQFIRWTGKPTVATSQSIMPDTLN